MFRELYLPTQSPAMLSKASMHQFVCLLLCVFTLIFSGCGQKKVEPLTPTIDDKVSITQPQLSETPPQTSDEIYLLLQQARQAGDINGALEGLSALIEQDVFPLNEEAAFKRAELLLEFKYPIAFDTSNQVLKDYPQHALAPYLHFSLALWWQKKNKLAQALESLIHVSKHPRLTRHLNNQALQTGFFIAERAPEWDAIRWILAAAKADPQQLDYWLRIAAGRASLASIVRLHHEQRIPDDFHNFYLYAARTRLMNGHMVELQSLAQLLTSSKPNDSITLKVQRWASGQAQQVTIGVLLPLSGSRAHFGREALQGIRLAIATHSDANNISLRIEDTGAGSQACIDAYKRLMLSNVSSILGPLLAEHSEALMPFLNPNIPVISLTSHNALAKQSDTLFVHSIARNIQATFLAKHAWFKGNKRIAVIENGSTSTTKEIDAFIKTFEALGGEIVERIILGDNIDNRAQLQDLRKNTDDEMLLATLDEELFLFSPEEKLEIRLPINFDAIYLALSGKKVANLAGQLAYSDVSGIPIYGSNRWQDGQLMNDRGRYLSKSKFIRINFPEVKNETSQKMQSKFREIWGNKQPGHLFGIAYDSANISAVLSRLGLYDKNAIQALHAREGFPGLTGYVYFDDEGVGHKDFRLYSVRRGKIVSAN